MGAEVRRFRHRVASQLPHRLVSREFNQSVFASLLPYLSRQGVTDASLYGANLLGACAPIYPDNPNDDDDVLNAVTVAMQGRQYSLASARLRQLLAQWNRIGISGGQLKGLVSLVP